MTRISTLLTAVIFTALGPGIGIVFWIVQIYWIDSFDKSKLILPTAADITSFGSLAPVAYALCWIPAALTGLVWGELARYLRTRHPLGWLTRAGLGAAIGGVAGAAWELLGPTADPLLFAKCGAVAGAALAVPFPRGRWLAPPSNNRSRGP